MFKNKFDTVTNVFKAKSSTSAKTLRSGLFVTGNVVMARAISNIDLSSLQGNSEDKVNKQDLIIIYDYINKVTQEENYNICIAFLIIVRTGHRKAESTARRKDSNRGMFFLALFFIANQ